MALTCGKPDEEAISCRVHAGTVGQDAGQVERRLQRCGNILHRLACCYSPLLDCMHDWHKSESNAGEYRPGLCMVMRKS